MEEIDIRDLLSYFYNHLVYFLIIVAVVVTLGCLYITFIQVPVYTSKTSIILTGFSSTDQNGITQTDLTINSKLVDTYQEIVKSRRVLNQVISNLDLNYAFAGLAKKISVSSVNNTEIIEIAVKDSNAQVACDIANEVASVFASEAKDLYNLSNVSILDFAEKATSPSNMNVTKQLLIFVFVGIVFAFVVLFVLYYFDTTIKSVQDVEKRIEFTILGTVPDYSKKKGAIKNEK